MILDIDLTADRPALRLADPDYFGALHVRALTRDGGPDWDALAAAAGDAWHVESDSVHIRLTLLEALAGERSAAPEWREGAATLVEFAQGNGWVDASGAIIAHVEWEVAVTIEPDDYRHVLGHYATGVAVITAELRGVQVGMACNSFTSVSLDPPLIAVCPAKTSQTWPDIRNAGRFLVNLMHRDHVEVVQTFARKDVDRFAAVPYHQRRCGPALNDAVGWIECALYTEYDAGDHTIALGRVIDLEAPGGLEPLVFFRGTYGTFSKEALSEEPR